MFINFNAFMHDSASVAITNSKVSSAKAVSMPDNQRFPS